LAQNPSFYRAEIGPVFLSFVVCLRKSIFTALSAPTKKRQAVFLQPEHQVNRLEKGAMKLRMQFE